MSAKTASGKGVKQLAWVSFGLAVIGGAALMVTFVGRLIAGVVGMFPAWVAGAALLIGAVVIVLDLWLDGTPNQAAILAAILLPSVSLAAGGSFGAAVRDGAGRVSGSVSGYAGALIGNGSPLVLAAVGVIGALLMAKRVIKKGAR